MSKKEIALSNYTILPNGGLISGNQTAKHFPTSERSMYCAVELQTPVRVCLDPWWGPGPVVEKR